MTSDTRDDVQADSGAPQQPASRGSRFRHRKATAALLMVLMACAAAATAAVLARPEGNAPQRAAALPPTAPVGRTSLADTQQFTGTLGYARNYQVAARGTVRGTVTWLPRQGQVISRGQRVFDMDGRPVDLFYGQVPLWRTLEVGVSAGPDVLEVEQNLVALGFGDGLTPSGDYSWAAAAAVSAWQDSLGLPQTGVISPGDVEIEPEAIRIASVSGQLGAAAGAICSATGTGRVVTVNVPVSQEQLAGQGTTVSVQLPGGVTTTGHVSRVGAVAQPGSQGSAAGVSQSYQGDQELQNATVQVQVTLSHPAVASRFDGAPAIVSFTSEQARNVLAVPVSALLAQPDGGYAVEMVSAGGRRTMVPVRLGMFAGGEVQVSGSGLRTGMRVEVPGQ
jgi:peptidoglycan hydrolase-like protein with peptidoglycan-binding domain